MSYNFFLFKIDTFLCKILKLHVEIYVSFLPPVTHKMQLVQPATTTVCQTRERYLDSIRFESTVTPPPLCCLIVKRKTSMER